MHNHTHLLKLSLQLQIKHGISVIISRRVAGQFLKVYTNYPQIRISQTSDILNYFYGPLKFEITKVDCILIKTDYVQCSGVLSAHFLLRCVCFCTGDFAMVPLISSQKHKKYTISCWYQLLMLRLISASLSFKFCTDQVDLTIKSYRFVFASLSVKKSQKDN